MTDQLPDLFGRPSRVVAGVLVALVHMALGWVLVNGMTGHRLMPVLSPVQVLLLEEVVHPFELPQPPSVQPPLVNQLFVPVPEIEVVRTAPTSLSMVTSIVPPVAEVAGTAQPSSTSGSQTQLLVVSESEVDYLVRPEVRYPAAAKRAREQGTVLLSVLINATGKVERVGIYQSSGYARLDEAAIRAVRHMRVRPYLRNGMAMAAEVRIPVEFLLSSAVTSA